MHNIVPRRTILRLLGGSAALALLPVHVLADTLDDATFRQTVIALLKRRHPEWQVVLGADPQTIKISNFEITRGAKSYRPYGTGRVFITYSRQ